MSFVRRDHRPAAMQEVVVVVMFRSLRIVTPMLHRVKKLGKLRALGEYVIGYSKTMAVRSLTHAR
jgi:hypothetical protein